MKNVKYKKYIENIILRHHNLNTQIEFVFITYGS